MAYHHDWEPDGVIVRFWGSTTGKEIDEAMELIRNHNKINEQRFIITDYLAVENFQVSTYEALIIAAHDYWISKSNDGIKIALIGEKPEILLAFQVYAQSALIKDTFEIGIFKAPELARNWATNRH